MTVLTVTDGPTIAECPSLTPKSPVSTVTAASSEVAREYSCRSIRWTEAAVSFLEEPDFEVLLPRRRTLLLLLLRFTEDLEAVFFLRSTCPFFKRVSDCNLAAAEVNWLLFFPDSSPALSRLFLADGVVIILLSFDRVFACSPSPVDDCPGTSTSITERETNTLLSQTA